MSEYGWLAIYCVAVLLFSICGGYVPFVGRVSHTKLQFYLSASAGVMLGAAFFHVMPDALRMSKGMFGWWMSLGVVGMFLIERFIAPHTHEVDGGHHNHSHHDKEHDHFHVSIGQPENHSGHENENAHGATSVQEHRAAAPAMAGWMAVVGLTIHTFINGVSLAAAVESDRHIASPDGWLQRFTGLAWPGLAMFLAIFLHKPADALAISTVLSRKGVDKLRIMLVQFLFAATIPVGVVAFYLTNRGIEKELEGQLIGAALAISSGTFLFIALSDLLPEVQFHRHDRVPLFALLILGVAFMGGIAALEGHDHAHSGHGHGANGTKEEADHDHDDNHDQGHGHGHKDHHHD